MTEDLPDFLSTHRGRPSLEESARISHARAALFARMEQLLVQQRRVWHRTELADALGVTPLQLSNAINAARLYGEYPTWLDKGPGGRGYMHMDACTDAPEPPAPPPPPAVKVVRRRKEPKAPPPEGDLPPSINLTDVVKASLMGAMVALQVRGHGRSIGAVEPSDMDNFIEEARGVIELFTESLEKMDV